MIFASQECINIAEGFTLMGIKPWELRIFVKGQVCHTEYTLRFAREGVRIG